MTRGIVPLGVSGVFLWGAGFVQKAPDTCPRYFYTQIGPPLGGISPAQFRLLQDFRSLNEFFFFFKGMGAPHRRYFHRQGAYRISFQLDLVHSYHQMSIAVSDRPLTCMLTSRRTMQLRVLGMGLKNAGSQFQCMMEWVLRDIPPPSLYIDSVLIGFTGTTVEEMIATHYYRGILPDN